jgi:DNA-binding Xre family transcriptional regulator
MRLTVHIKELADTRGWDTQELANRIGADPQTTQSLYEGRSTEIDVATLGRLSQALGVLPHDILASVEEKQPSASDAPPPRSI